MPYHKVNSIRQGRTGLEMIASISISLKMAGSLHPPSKGTLRSVYPFEFVVLFRLTPPKNVEAALRDYARIPVKEFALIVMQENGEQRTYSSASLSPHQPKIFTKRFEKNFQQYARWVNTEGPYPESG